ncbi:MAG: carbohydrate ABC transporter permease [Lentisphaeria bacterium]|jgi:multiple sugar transport system permease protein
MPIISEIGKRSLKVRLLHATIYLVLLAGAATMLYPLLLMLAGSVKSDADPWTATPYPEFWFNDRVLFRKFLEAKYTGATSAVQQAWCQPVASWRRVEPPPPVAPTWLRDFRAWRAQLTPEERQPGHTAARGLLPKNLRAYRRHMARLFAGDLDAYNRAANQLATAWSAVRLPVEELGRYRNRNLPPAFRQELLRWRATLPATDLVVTPARGQYAFGYLQGRYTSQVAPYNQAHQTAFASYDEVPFPDRAPEPGDPTRQDWETFVRQEIPLALIRLEPAAEPAFRRFLASRHPSVAHFNQEQQTPVASLAEIPFPSRLDAAPELRIEFEAFLKDPNACPAAAIRIVDAERRFRDFLAARHGGRLPAGYPGLGAIIAASDWADCLAHKAALRWEFTQRNYWQVFDYIALHGNGLRNTLVYCALAVATALLVNPLAAYALSRFKLPATYKLLLFCLATMAFPGEVTMIPGFILLKRFPLWPILTGLATALALFWLLGRLRPRWPESRRALAALAAGLASGGLLLPWLAPALATTSLLNSFAALVLPGMANGFAIFLLKGFFDSIPKELYEAAEIDGASEWTQFWMLSMNLSKPILAVLALNAFTGAYSAFMMALIIIPDPKMWTLMVWIYQLQTQAHPAVVYAALAIAAIPTFLIFALCQNLILRGIVVPTEK